MNKLKKISNGVKFFIFLTSLFCCCYFFCNRCAAQRAAGESPIISGAKNIAKAAVPAVASGYQRMESRNSAVKGISNLAGQALPLVEKAAPIVRKGVVIGKKILKVLKKILR